MNEFKNYKNEEIIYIPNAGGDALIAAGTMQLFDKHKIKYILKIIQNIIIKYYFMVVVEILQKNIIIVKIFLIIT